MAPVCYFCGSNLHKSSDCPQYVAEVAFSGDNNNKIQQEGGTSANPSPFHHHHCNTMTTIDLLLPQQPDLWLPRQQVDNINNNNTSIYLARII